MDKGVVLRPARGVPPGRIIKRELDARGWTQKDLAAIMERPPKTINGIIRGYKQITPETALQLADAFGTSPELWLNLEANYRLYQARREHQKSDVARKGYLYSLAPISEMIKRGWLRATDSIADLEQQFRSFMEISSLDAQPPLAARFRISSAREPETNAQRVWIQRVKHLAQGQTVSPYDPERLRKALPTLLACASYAEDAAKIPHLLQSLGVYFVIVPHPPHTHLDGAAFKIEGHPVVALTLRYDRIDNFWFTLLHELAHIVADHQGFYLDSLDKRDGDETEHEANQMATQWLIAREELDAFVRSTRPYFSRKKILAFASRHNRCPGIILGQLHYHYKKDVPSSHLRSLLVKVKPYFQERLDTVGPIYRAPAP